VYINNPIRIRIGLRQLILSHSDPLEKLGFKKMMTERMQSIIPERKKIKPGPGFERVPILSL